MSEARALTNFAGNSVATVLVAVWTGDFDRERANQVLAGNAPFDEATLLDEEEGDDRPGPDESGDRELSKV
jgi:aerobic C4-dicarboxylate transport protein